MRKKQSDVEYKSMLENYPIYCVNLVIRGEKGALLVLRKQEPAINEWWLPGGRVYKNERLEEAAVRKAYEETGLKIKILRKIGVYEIMFEKNPFNNLLNRVYTTNICYLTSQVNKNLEIKLDKISSDYRWVNTIEKNLHYYVRKVLMDSNIFRMKHVT